jgi:hypothetical protein
MGVESGEGLVVASDFGHGDSQSKVIFRARQVSLSIAFTVFISVQLT